MTGTQDGGWEKANIRLTNPVCFSIRKLADKQSKYKRLFVTGNRAKYTQHMGNQDSEGRRSGVTAF